MVDHSPSTTTKTSGVNDHFVRALLFAACFMLLLFPGNRLTLRADFPAANLINAFTLNRNTATRLLNAQNLFEMAGDGQSEEALLFVADYADRVGNWTSAPGDIIAFDPYMPWRYRGAVAIVDNPRSQCTAQIPSRSYLDVDDCIAMHSANEHLVRFGRAMFATRSPDSTIQPRYTFDDILATYIEEVGHSWQEYFYETEGRGDGNRTRKTSLAAALLWTRGREYQVKTYVLNLDGRILRLSKGLRATLMAEICRTRASPLGHPIPSYGPPPGWLYPEAWPTSAPPTGNVRAYCRYMNVRI